MEYFRWRGPLGKRVGIYSSTGFAFCLVRVKVMKYSLCQNLQRLGALLRAFILPPAKFKSNFTVLQMKVFLFAALIIDVLVVMIIKLAFRRPRPRHNRMDMLGTVTAIDGFSFPSGHATRTAMVVCFMLSQFSPWPWTVAILLWAVAVPISRVMLGRHYFMDVIIGVLIGLLQYRCIVLPLWLSSHTCEVLLQPIREELHI